jgi:hypothetical protein
VNVFRPPGPYLHTRYDNDNYDRSEVSKTPLRDLSDFKNGGKSKKKSNKYKKLSRRRRHHHSKKNRKSMKRK